ncbi:MAG: DUF3142 domain-containing protein [Opitutaceae bacterium]|jgi:hypothetical protein
MRFCVLGFAGSLGLLSFALTSCRPAESRATLTQEAYVWQRAHTATVADAVRAHAPAFDQIVVLAAEVSWVQGHARIVRVPQDISALKTASSLGLAIRVNAFTDSFSAESDSTRTLVDLATSLLADARAAGLRITELQIDFDAAEKRLADYRLWLAAIHPVIAPARLTFTALPSWLKNNRDFATLASAADGFVLQVHSLARPGSPDSTVALCDPQATRDAVRTAARFNRPFRIALPTYGYRLAFDSYGRFFALSAEGPAPDWPAGTITRELSADPSSLAALVAEITHNHPSTLTGILWYRLPIAGDRLNWTWPTLARVMRGETPVARPILEARATNVGLVEYAVINTGDGPFVGPFSATVTWTGASRLAADSLPPFSLEDTAATTQRLAASSLRLAPGDRQSVGWLRLDQAPLSLHVSPSP